MKEFSHFLLDFIETNFSLYIWYSYEAVSLLLLVKSHTVLYIESFFLSINFYTNYAQKNINQSQTPDPFIQLQLHGGFMVSLPYYDTRIHCNYKLQLGMPG